MNLRRLRWSFNTQPPEGGWVVPKPANPYYVVRFNTQPPEGGWYIHTTDYILYNLVSTHSRPKAAGAT